MKIIVISCEPRFHQIIIRNVKFITLLANKISKKFPFEIFYVWRHVDLSKFSFQIQLLFDMISNFPNLKRIIDGVPVQFHFFISLYSLLNACHLFFLFGRELVELNWNFLNIGTVASKKTKKYRFFISRFEC